MFKINTQQKVYYTLRIASALCFIGHGLFGVITKPIWCNYFAVFGIGHQLAYQLMPLVGYVDILCGIVILVYPIRAVVGWLVVWGFITALLRPLSGEPFFEFLERFGNFGAPLALLIVSGGIRQNAKDLFSPVIIKNSANGKTWASLMTVLRFAIFFLFLGHGLLNMTGKKALLNQYMTLGFSDPIEMGWIIGVFEILAGLLVFIRPVRQLLLVLLIWKVTSELFYPKYELFELVERSGSYGVILALWFALESASLRQIKSFLVRFQYYVNSISQPFKKYT